MNFDFDNSLKERLGDDLLLSVFQAMGIMNPTSHMLTILRILIIKVYKTGIGHGRELAQLETLTPEQLARLEAEALVKNFFGF